MNTTQAQPNAMRRAALDAAMILAMSFAAEAAHFSVRQGRAILCADSLQYLDNAQALLDDERRADFGFRKPGYSMLLTATAVLFGRETWSAVAFNHVCQALLPLAAYGLGRNLRSRALGWFAALLTIAQLQTSVWGERIMSEASYACVLSLGILLLVSALTRERWMGRLAGAGLLLAGAWLIRPTAVVVIVAAALIAVWTWRSHIGRAVIAVGCITLPLLLAVLLECGMNFASHHIFRPCTGTLGAMILMRARHMQNFDFPSTEAARRCLDLLPERSPEDAYRVNHVDTWIARCHAIRERGMTEWQIDELMRNAGLEMIRVRPWDYVRGASDILLRHLLRRTDGPSISRVPSNQLAPILVHPRAHDDADFPERWYAYWALPRRSLDESLACEADLHAQAKRRAPFGRSAAWDALRYLASIPPVVDVMGVLRHLAGLWPGFALLLSARLGLNRKSCALLAIAYLLDAMLVALCGASDQADIRYQWTWIVTDTTLAAALPAGLLEKRRGG